MRLLRSWFALSLLMVSTSAWAGHINGQVRLDTGQLVDNARVQMDRGMKLSASHDAAGALEHYKKAIDLFPGFAEAYLLMGGVYFEQGKFVLAEDSFVKALNIESHLASALYALGLTRNLMG